MQGPRSKGIPVHAQFNQGSAGLGQAVCLASRLADDPLVIVRGEGSWLIDSDGNRYLAIIGGHFFMPLACAVVLNLELFTDNRLLDSVPLGGTARCQGLS